MEGAIGGPLVRVGAVIPVPLSTVGARYGVAERADVAAHVHLTSLSFGVAGLDVGGSWLALAQDGAVPALSLGGRLYGFTSVLASRQAPPRAYLEVSPTVSYLLGGRFLSYASATGLVQLAGGPPLLSLAVGEEVRLASWGVQLELALVPAGLRHPLQRGGLAGARWHGRAGRLAGRALPLRR